jgi:Tol biopolymer transport system component
MAVILLAACQTVACGDDDSGSHNNPTSSAINSVTNAPSQATGARPSPGDWGAEPNGLLAFVAFREVHQEIFIKDLPGGEERNLTSNPAEDFDPDLSDDGSRLAFVSSRDGTAQIFVMNSDGSDLRQITRADLGGQTPRFSRDGEWIAFAHGPSVAVMPSEGGEIRTIMEGEPEATAAPCRAGAFVGGWSPDDEAITYYSASVTQDVAQVCIVPFDGGEPQVIVNEPGVFAVEPVFSPDGRYIAYRAITGGQHDIWVVDLETGDRYNLTSDPDLDIEPEWSPDGQWIAFGSLRPEAGQFDLFVMRPDGTDVRQVTTDPAKEANPVWSVSP